MAKGVGIIFFSRYAVVGWLAIFSSLVPQMLGQATYKLIQNENVGSGIYVAHLQVQQEFIYLFYHLLFMSEKWIRKG